MAASKQTRGGCLSRGAWGILFLLLMLRNCAAGMEYWPQLDDYIQYHNYAVQFSFPELQRVVGVLAHRPLAGLADYFLWSPLFGRMILGVAVISALYVASAWMMDRLLRRYIPVGPIFPVVMILLPLGAEGTYWMSASTRTVMGLFFACLAALAYRAWLDRGSWGWALAFMGLILVPFGFYEQSAVLAMTLVLGMALLERKTGWRRRALAVWSIPAAGLYLGITGLLAHSGVYAGRAELMLPASPGYWTAFLPDVLGQLRAVFVQGNFYTLTKGLIRGMELLISQQMILWGLFLVALCVLYVRCATGGSAQEARGPKTVIALLIGALLAAAPLAPFFIVGNPWFSFRGALTSLPGIALVCDAAVMAVWPRRTGWRAGPAVLGALMALIFCVAGVSELWDYRATWEADQKAAGAVLSALEGEGRPQEDVRKMRIGILGIEPTFLPDQNFLWHEHIHGCTESMWAFTGLIGSMAGSDAPASVTPLPSNPMYRQWNAQANRPDSFDALYLYRDGAVTRVTLENMGEGRFDVLDETGDLLGRIWEENGWGYFQE